MRTTVGGPTLVVIALLVPVSAGVELSVAVTIWVVSATVLVVKMRHDGTSVCNRTSAVP